MPGTLRVATRAGCSLPELTGAARGLLERAERGEEPTPILLIAELVGDAVLLGRHQRLKSAIALDKLGHRELLRRNSGGRSIAVGAGTLGVALVVPDPGMLTGERIGFDKFLNRAVRGLLAGLTHAGASGGAHYFGRDFVSASSQQLAVVGQENGRRAALFEGFVAVERKLELPAGLNNYLAHGDPRVGGPEHATLVAQRGSPIGFEALGTAIAEGYAQAHRLELHAHAGSLPRAPLPPAHEDEAGFEDSGVADIPIGFVEALVKHEAERITAARIRGDLLAPAFALEGLEQSLVGCPLTFEALGPRVDAAFHQPGAFIFGLRELGVLAEALLAAAGKL